ncbi:MAG: methyltransferase [Crocinitomicaceae bacterium]|nr:methyltransferase [Crocinitomicaceae bacterium]
MSSFRFKQFEIIQDDNAMKVGTDSMVLGSFINGHGRKRGLDIGSGTGVLSLMVTQGNDDIKFDAVELDELSATECALNFKNSPWSDRLKVHQGNFLEFESEERYDLIISNPPYYQSTLLNQDSRKANARHEQSLPMREFILKSRKLLSDDGEFWFIVPAEDEQVWKKQCTSANLHLVEKIAIHGKEGGDIKRIIFVFCNHKSILEESSFSVRKKSNEYSEEYKELTRDFHFNEL